ncbi:LysM peptidoglycan-binding domain-containing protein [Paenibacillus sp. LHD-117]|uniref:LysM peptidoglycan-binding domain-containing protein n=1 Tax=Paenibacillus sp. LHD-117 TaxID=3071412 RepID=UPI0027DEEC8A|nr:LysM peptidoglycan-binding domain-containing protein [Paenibacillus sp. LHD-117]MDQ6422548.1 LysM peptidoglycan-binding domain-containing protein [Paenibacillus sp. LHD-117]
MQIHTVQKNDTLWKLSQSYGVPLEHLFVANGLTSQSVLVIGQAIIIPTEPEPTTHKVLVGESLWKISQRYGVTIQELAAANGIRNPALIYPGQLLKIPAPAKPVIEVNAYVERMGQTGATLTANVGDYLTYLSPFSYRILANGSLIPLDDEAVIAAAYEKRAVPMMVITNFEGDNFSPEIAHAVVADAAIQNQVIANIVAVMRQKRYLALNVDLEYVPPADRELFNVFLQRLVDTLHPYGYLVSSALAPKLSATQDGALYEAHDYEAHGRILDFVILMTYEWGWAGGPPRAVAPLNEVVKVLNYALTVIPSNKIIMGIPLYGYDWTLPYITGGRWAPSVSSHAAVERAAKYGGVIQYDEPSQAPNFHYFDEQGKEHVVWFEDARSIQAKLDVVKSLKLRGVSYWVLGVAFPQNWFVLGENFTIKKLI